MRTACVIVPGLLLVLAGGGAMAGVLNVPGDYSEIYDAVQAAAPGDTVMVAAGTYHDCTHETAGPGSNLACVIMKSDVTLIGAGPDATIIDALELGLGIFMELVDNVRIENLQVTGAFAEVYGAGILVRQVDSTVQISDVKIHANGDGGIICINNAAPVITRVTFTNNHAKQGGGLAIEDNSSATILDCVFDNNDSPVGGGIFIRLSDATVTDCIIQNNITTANAGGVRVESSVTNISDCAFLNNTTAGNGGGIAYESCTSGSLTDCVLQGNVANGDFSEGGGAHVSSSSLQMTNLLVVENSTPGNSGLGGGIAIQFTPSPTLINVTVANNACGASGTGGGILCNWWATPTIDKSIIAFATTGEGIACQFDAVPVISCTDLYGNAGGNTICGTDAGGNFSVDPQFCGTTGFEYNLQTGSPCIPGNHPGGETECDGDLIGAMPEGCTAIGVEETPDLMTQLLGNAPNPFNPRTTIFFVLAEPGPAALRIFDLRGRQIETFTWHDLPVGRKDVVWDGRNHAGQDMPSGVYLYQLETHGIVQTQRMSLIR